MNTDPLAWARRELEEIRGYERAGRIVEFFGGDVSQDNAMLAERREYLESELER